jgi:hypothetical protein
LGDAEMGSKNREKKRQRKIAQKERVQIARAKEKGIYVKTSGGYAIY